MATLPALSPLPRQLEPCGLTTRDREAYYANHYGVLSERRWEWAAANGTNGWTSFPTRRGSDEPGVIDLSEFEMRRRRADRWRCAAEESLQRMR